MVRRIRAALAAALVACTVTVAAATPSSASRPGASPAPVGTDRPARLTLPAPTGPYPVGTADLHLVDSSRTDPWTAVPSHRELMVSIWYPARNVDRFPRAPHMSPGAAAHFGGADGAASTLYGIPAGQVDFAATRTAGHLGAPVARHRRPFPVVLYSPGAGDPRTWATTLVQDLASRGYVVVTVDHTYETSEVEFPDGRVVTGLLARLFQEARQPDDFQRLAARVFDTRLADIRFVLDRLAALRGGTNPDARGQSLPAGLAGALDLRRTGMVGISAGGLTALQAMHDEPRIRAAADLGGTIESPLVPDPIGLWPVARQGLDRPFMLVGAPDADHHRTPSWQMVWDHSTGWRVDLHLAGATGEDSYKDTLPLLPQIARQLGLPDSFVTGVVGDVDPRRAVRAEETVVAAFFDRWLRGGDGRVLDGPSRCLPDVVFVP
ncbi:alpha/beta hydrolase family protein [Micromonospora sp. NPDC051300]|uniref:alpha/beta hydrolase family protein n=1 Tax=Micromonospora sp. NPDC051300 TaxID=3364286 RepID=UPI0037A08409